LVSRVSNVSIEGGWIDGNRWNQTPDHNTDTDLARFGIFLSYLNSNCTVKGLTATNFTNCGIDVAFANDILIDGVHTSGNADGGIWIDIDTFNFTVQNCVSDTDASGMPAVFFDDMGNHVGLFLNDTVINAGHCPSPNRFSPGVAFALYWGSSTTKPYGITWRDCTSINSGGAAALWINLGTNCTVENCSFTLSDVDGINLNGCSNIIVRNNIIANNGWYGVRETQGAHDNSIYGNNLQSNGIGDLSLSGANTVAHHNNPNIPYP
jgi:parallel beta-helix repeat protein